MSKIIKPFGPVVTEITLRWDVNGQCQMDGKTRRLPRLADVTKAAIIGAAPMASMQPIQMLQFVAAALSSFLMAFAGNAPVHQETVKNEGGDNGQNGEASGDNHA